MSDTYFQERINKIAASLYRTQMLQRELFLVEKVIPNLKWHHKLLFKISPRFIKNVIVQVEQEKRYGAKLYGKIYWMDEQNKKINHVNRNNQANTNTRSC